MEQELWDKMTKFTPLSTMTNFEKHPNLKKLEENIWVIPNFISEEDREKLMNCATSVPEEEWWITDRSWWNGKFLVPDGDQTFDQVVAKLKVDVREYLPDDVYLGAFGSIHRLIEGQGMFIHTDNPTEKRDLIDDDGNKIGETDGVNNYCILAMVVYLNDFNGGEIFFPQIGFEYKANAGDLLLFPGTGKEYDHGVRPLASGPNRYITTGFGYDQKVERLKEMQYVFEDVETGDLLNVEPSKLVKEAKASMIKNED